MTITDIQLRPQPAALHSIWRDLRVLIVCALALMLGACGGGLDVGGVFSDSPSDGQPQLQTQGPASQPARIGLLLPLGADGEVGQIGRAMKQAAEMALFDSGASNITLITKDTRGQADGAVAAAQAAIGEGAEILLGPLLSSEVSAVGPIAAARNIKVIAFSSVAGVAGNGVYLMSFLPQEEVSNLVRHAASQGIRNIAALIPNSNYGATVQSALENAARSHGANIVMVERYSRTSSGLTRPAQSIARAASDPGRGIQALFLPEGGQLLSDAGQQLTAAGFSPVQTRMLGTGLWDDPVTAGIPIAQGGWFAGVSNGNLEQFEQRYLSTYSAKPHRLASLGYDATSLAVILSRGPGPDRFSAQAITNPEGFQGVNGLFRFLGNGHVQRGLAILSVSPGGNQVIAPAPGRFGPGF